MIRGKDYTQQLADYIKRNVAKGYTTEALRWALVNQGHMRTQVDKALLLATEQMAAAAPKMEKPVLQEALPVELPKKKGFLEWLFG